MSLSGTHQQRIARRRKNHDSGEKRVGEVAQKFFELSGYPTPNKSPPTCWDKYFALSTAMR
jgi:hypothetical protein